MNGLSAFVGHSFREEDQPFVRKILDYLSTIVKAVPGFSWDSAFGAEAQQVSAKVLQKIEGKDLFIGICSIAEYVVPDRSVGTALKLRNAEPRGSLWITQEIGLAIGRGMKIILLLEKGIRSPGGLQSDLEYINFERDAVEHCFPGLLQMIAGQRPRETTAAAGASAEASAAAASSPAPEAKPPEPQTLGDQLLKRNILQAAFDGTLEDVKAAVETYRRSIPAPTEREVAEWYVIGLDHLRYDGKGIALETLRELRAQHPESEIIARSLAATFEALGESDAAIGEYVAAAALSELPGTKAYLLSSAATLRHQQEKPELAHELAGQLEALIDLNSPAQAAVVATAATLWRTLGEFERFCALSELSLELDPALEQERFALASACSDRELNSLAYVHYSTLVRTNAEHAGGWNNLGVVADALQLRIRATEAYERARTLRNSRAGGNLAYRLIDLGHLALAKQVCEETERESGPDERLAAAEGRLLSARDEEDKRAEQVREKIRPLREFLRRWAREYFDPRPLPGALAFDANLSDGTLTLTLTVSGQHVRGNARLVSVPSAARTLSALAFGSAASKPEVREYAVEGRVHCRAGSLSLQETGPSAGTAPVSLLTIATSGRSYLFGVDGQGSVTLASTPLSVNTVVTVCSPQA